MMAEPNWILLANSLLVACASTFAAFILGFFHALAMSASPCVVRRLLLGCAFISLVLPSFLVTNAWIDLVGVNGVMRNTFPINIFSMAGTIWILSLLLWPVVALALSAAWPKLETMHFEVDPALRGLKLIRRLLWPTARPLALTAAAVVFALALSNFAVPAILQVKVYSTEAWIQFNTNLNARAALGLCWPLLLSPLVLIALVRQPQFPWPRHGSEDLSRVFRRQLGRPLFIGALVLSISACLLGVAVPLLQLFTAPRTWSEFWPAAAAGVPALVHSVSYAAITAAAAVGMGLLLAALRGFGWLWLLFFLPGILLGIAAVEGFNRPGLEWLSRSSLIVVFLLVLRYLALARSICRTGLRAVDPLLLDAGRMDGAAGVTLCRRILWPQIAPHACAAAYLVYLLCLWDVETILMAIPPGGETLALRVFNLLHYGHNAHVNALCILLLFTGLAPLAVFACWRLVTRLRHRARAKAIA